MDTDLYDDDMSVYQDNLFKYKGDYYFYAPQQMCCRAPRIGEVTWMGLCEFICCDNQLWKFVDHEYLRDDVFFMYVDKSIKRLTKSIKKTLGKSYRCYSSRYLSYDGPITRNSMLLCLRCFVGDVERDYVFREMKRNGIFVSVTRHRCICKRT